jgi:hypothetical protein
MPLKCLALHCCTALLLLNMGLFSTQVKAQVDLDNKAKLTAAFIYQITKFTMWPDSLFNSSNPVFSICVLGEIDENLFENFTELEKKSTQGYQINLVQLNNKQQLFERSGNNCKVLYATDEQWQELTPEQINKLTQTTLLIGSSRDFLELGGMLALLVIDNKMKIFINSINIDKTPIRLESRLKALAKAV